MALAAEHVIYEVWGEGGSWEELEASSRAGLPDWNPAHLAADASWCAFRA